MEIKSLKDFKALVKACRQLGVDAIEVGDLKIGLGKEPFKASNSPAINQTAFPEASIKVPAYDGPITEPESVPTEGLTEEQLLMWSAEGQQSQ